MGLIDTIRSLVTGTDEDDQRRGDADVTVEHEPDAGSEAAVKGTGEEPAAAGTDAAASTGSMPETPPETPTDGEVGEAAEPGEAAGPTSQTERAPDDDVTAADAETAEEGAGSGVGLESVSGIGEAYANRLHEAGVDDVDALVAADAATVAEDTGIGEARIERWQERASGGD